LNDVRLRFPVVCPICGVESLANLCLMDMVRTLYCKRSIALASQCHGSRWDANQIEIEQIKAYCMATIVYAIGTTAPTDAIAPAVVTDSSIVADMRPIPGEVAKTDWPLPMHASPTRTTI